MAAKNKFLNAMKMPSIDDMFSSEADRQRESGDLVTEVPLSELHPFVGHPFEVRDDEDMQKLVELGMEYEIDSMDLLSQKGYCLHWPAGGVCNTGDTFLTELSDVSGDVVDMEAYAQALVCRAKNVPFISVKYVTDIIGQNSVKHWEDKLADARKGLGEFFEKLGGV